MSIIKHLEAVGLRLLPGIINAAALLVVGSRIGAEDYGRFSLAVASSGFAAVVAFGPLYLGAVAQYAQRSNEESDGIYEATYVGVLGTLVVLTSVAGTVAMLFNIVTTPWLCAAISFGVYTSCLELLRARIQIWRFGISSLTQSISYITLVNFCLDRESSAQTALWLFAISYVIGLVAGLLLIGKFQLQHGSRSAIVDTLKLGVGSVISNGAEQALYVGMRYTILAFGSSEALGVFSFCVDLAQRTVGFLLNAASFVFVPMAFQSEAVGDTDRFATILWNAAGVSLLLSFGTFVATILILETTKVPVLSGELFDPLIFALVCFAVVINRLKKLSVDPFALRAGLPLMLSFGYLFGAPIALGGGAVALYYGQPDWFAAAAYGVGYLAAALVTLYALKCRRSIF